jgi:hypothetical protein
MSQWNDLLRRERELSVPPHLSTEIERAVLRRIEKRTPGQRARRIMSLRLAGAGVLVVVLAAVFLRSGREPAPPAAVQFTESVLLLDDHVCIWLEPVNGNFAWEAGQ